MHFEPPLQRATLVRRYKRFLADVEWPDRTLTTVHCPNTGAMLGCAEPGATVWLQRAANPKRKYPYTWELVRVDGTTLVGINTGRANALVREAIEGGAVATLAGYRALRGEVPYGRERSRIDLLLEDPARAPCYVEVKNVTAAVSAGVALFPDAVTARGVKHLRELSALVSDAGARAVMVFCVQREDVFQVRPADAIDPTYGAALRAAMATGVEVVALRASVSERRVRLDTEVPVVVSDAG